MPSSSCLSLVARGLPQLHGMRWWLMVCWLLWGCAVMASAAQAQSVLPVPSLTAPVLDQAAALTPAERESLNQQLLALERQYGSQMAVVLLDSTAPEDINAYAHRVASHWKLGRQGVGDGLLLVIAMKDRSMRLEVARALEGAMPDVLASRILQEQLAPALRAGAVAAGIQAVVAQIERVLAGEDLPPVTPTNPSEDLEDSLLFVGLLVLLVAPVLRSALGRGLAGLLMGFLAAGLIWVLFDSSTWSAIGGAAAAAYTWFFASKLSADGAGRGGGDWGGGGGGGFSSGGGGSFGGGGASGRW